MDSNIEGSTLLNDDNPIVRVFDDHIRVYGSPWSGKTPCYRNESCPVGSFVKIKQAPENKATRLSVVETYVQIYSSSSGFKTDEDMADWFHNSIEQIAVRVPSFELACRPDREAALVCFDAVKKCCDE